MNRRLALLTKLLVLVSLILASLPSGAIETVCVVGSEKRVVPVRKCGMPCCAHKPQPTSKAACCKPKAAPRAALCGAAGLNCHCETRFVATSMPVQAAVVKLSLSDLEPGILGTPPHVRRISSWILIREDPVIGTDVDPPRKVPRTPMLGRAPPVNNG